MSYLKNFSKPLVASSALALGASIFLLNRSIFNVDGGQKAIIFSRIKGLKRHTYEEGIHFCLPYFEWPIVFNTRTKAYTTSSPTGTKDLQTVNISLRVLYKPNSSKLQKIYRSVGKDIEKRVLPSICNEVLKSIVARYNASELITRRQQISLQIRSELTKRASDFDLQLDDVAITELAFGRRFSQAVEAKQVALQEAQRAEFLVVKAEQQRQRKVVVAEGEAQSAELIGKAIGANPMYLKLRRIEVAKRIANILAKSPNNVYLDSDTLLLNINSET